MLSANTTAASNGFLLDGESPNPLPVRISLLDTAVRFVPQGDRKAQMWDFSDIDWEATRKLNDQLRIKRRDGDQWIVATDAALIAEIQAERKHWTRRNFWVALPDTKMAIRACVGAVVICVALWFSWPVLTIPAVKLVPQSTRSWLGDTAQKMAGMDDLCTDPDGNAALQRLTARLTAQRPELKDIRVVPVQSNMINALTLANDKVLLTSAIIKQAQSPDEIAGVLAHEFGHIAHRHVLRGVLGQLLSNAIISMFTGAHGTEAGYINTLTSSAHTRAFEAEADATGISLLREAHIASQGLAEFFNRVAHMEGTSSRFLQYFASHPPSKEREALMRNTVIPDATPAMDYKDWLALKNVCAVKEEAKPEAPAQPEEQPETQPQAPQRSPLDELDDTPDDAPAPPQPSMPDETLPQPEPVMPAPRDPNQPRDL